MRTKTMVTALMLTAFYFPAALNVEHIEPAPPQYVGVPVGLRAVTNRGLLLDERNGVSYSDGQQDQDGLIRIIYDYSRTGERLILMALFREEDVSAGRTDSRTVHLRQRVSQGSGGREKARN